MVRRKIKYTKVSSIYIKDLKPLDSVLIQSLKDLNIDEKLNEQLLIKFWQNLFGPSIISATNNITYKNKTLTIYINSSVIKSELLMMKSQIFEKFRNQFGKENIMFFEIY